MRIEVVRPRELGPAEAARWAALQAAGTEIHSPYLSLGWARIVDSVRPDARVAVIEDGGAIQAFFPAQRCSPFAAMGMGAPLCDYEGLVAAEGFTIDPRLLARALKVHRLDFAHIPATQTGFLPFVREESVSHVLDLSGGADAFFAARRSEGSSTFRDADKKRRKVQRELGEIRTETWSKNQADFEQMLAWKRAHTDRTDQPDVYGRQWVRDVLQRVLESDDPECRGYFTATYIRDKFVAGILSLASTTTAHAWVTAYDVEIEKYSPGLLGWMDFLTAGGADGFKEIDFGAGDYRYKLATANVQRRLVRGFVGRPSMASLVRSSEYALRRELERRQLGRWSEMPAKAMRRLDVMRGLGLFSATLK